jgi:hypothetical protein
MARFSAAAAMSRAPANWPPLPRTTTPEAGNPPGTSHLPADGVPPAGDEPTTGAEQHDPGLPVAGRRPHPPGPAEPVDWFRSPPLEQRDDPR